MSQVNCARKGCKDVFHAFMVQNATYEGEPEFPCIAPETACPTKLISFSNAIGGTDFDAWVHFYEDDVSLNASGISPLNICRSSNGIKA